MLIKFYLYSVILGRKIPTAVEVVVAVRISSPNSVGIFSGTSVFVESTYAGSSEPSRPNQRSRAERKVAFSVPIQCFLRLPSDRRHP